MKRTHYLASPWHFHSYWAWKEINHEAPNSEWMCVFFKNVLRHQIDALISFLLSLIQPKQCYCSCHRFHVFFFLPSEAGTNCPVIGRLNKRGPGFPAIIGDARIISYGCLGWFLFFCNIIKPMWNGTAQTLPWIVLTMCPSEMLQGRKMTI